MNETLVRIGTVESIEKNDDNYSINIHTDFGNFMNIPIKAYSDIKIGDKFKLILERTE